MQLLENAVAGVRVTASTPLDDVWGGALAAEETALVIVFEAFRDGRGFSLASTLRERGWTGRLIAAGDILPDQARHLNRAGFDAVELVSGADHEAWRRMLGAFTTVYQPATDTTVPAWHRRTEPAASTDLARLAQRLNDRLADADAETILRAVLDPASGLNVAVLSSFGAEAAVLLDHVATVDTATPVLFLDTGQQFFQTLNYRRQLALHLGLSDIRIVVPDTRERALIDPDGGLWQTDPDACCDLRKVRPLARASVGFNALITGRKRHQTETRRSLDIVEVLDGTLRINPLAGWEADRIEAHMVARRLPRHPLVGQGYASIGCWPCTRPIDQDEASRAGRWSGLEKVECGIHLGRRQSAA